MSTENLTNSGDSMLISRVNFKMFGFAQSDVNTICSALHRYVPFAERRKIITEMTRKTTGSYQQITWAIHWAADDAINVLKNLCAKNKSNTELFKIAIKKIEEFKEEKVKRNETPPLAL